MTPARKDADEREAWVLLNEVDGVGPVTFGRLIEALGSARAVLATAAAPRAIGTLMAATTDGDRGTSILSAATATAIADAAAHPAAILEPVLRAGVGVLLLVDEGYPARLRRVALPPPVLYVRGALPALDPERAVAVVGTRRPTEIGRGTAARIADAVAGLGATVVSGLAFGIDAAAHASAVQLGTPTLAVIGGGHERLYPAAHRGLARRIVDGGGAVVSEFAPDTIPTRGTFPRRNRIISGLADAIVVVEAGARSGALTTAAWALEQGRDLYLVPGRLDDPTVAGSLAFLREAGPNARIVAGIPELLEDLGLYAMAGGGASSGRGAGRRRRMTGASAPEAVLASLPPVERSIAAALIAGSTGVDELAAASGLGGATILGALTALEMRGLVLEAFGRYRPAGPLAAAGTRKPRVARRGARLTGDGSSAARVA